MSDIFTLKFRQIKFIFNEQDYSWSKFARVFTTAKLSAKSSAPTQPSFPTESMVNMQLKKFGYFKIGGFSGFFFIQVETLISVPFPFDNFYGVALSSSEISFDKAFFKVSLFEDRTSLFFFFSFSAERNLTFCYI